MKFITQNALWLKMPQNNIVNLHKNRRKYSAVFHIKLEGKKVCKKVLTIEDLNVIIQKLLERAAKKYITHIERAFGEP